MKDSEIKKLLFQYNEILAKLKENNVIRTSKLVAEYGEYVAVLKLKKAGLELAKSGNKGYDAIDSKGKTYEIKTRKQMPYNTPTNFQVRKEQIKNTDFLLCLYFDNNWKLTKLYKIPSSKAEIDKGYLLISKKLDKYNVL